MDDWMSNEKNKQNGGLCILTKCIVYNVVGWMANQDVWVWLSSVLLCACKRSRECVVCEEHLEREKLNVCVTSKSY